MPDRKPTAKDTSFRITKFRLEQYLSRYGESFSIPLTWNLIIALCIVLGVLILILAVEFEPALPEPGIEISVTRINQNQLQVMVTFMGKDTLIDHLAYKTSLGTGLINKSTQPYSTVRDIGEIGIVPVSGYDEYVEIAAALNNEKTIKIFAEKV